MNGKVKINLNVIHDPKLSLKAKGIYSCICMLGTINDLFQLYELCKESEDSLKSGVKELIDNGYSLPIDKTRGCLYIITDTYGNYKIGITNDMLRRNHEFSTDLPRHKIILTYYSQRYKELEKIFHKKFKTKNIKNEWFRLTNQDIEYIKEYLCNIN